MAAVAAEAQKTIHRGKSSLACHVPELGLVLFVEHHIVGLEHTVGHLCLVVHLLRDVKEGDFLAIVELRVVQHHGIRKLGHGGLCRDGEAGQGDVGLAVGTCSAHVDARHRALRQLVGSGDAGAGVSQGLAHVHGDVARIHLHKHVVVGHSGCLLLKSHGQQRGDARIVAHHVHPFHALPLLCRGSGVFHRGRLFAYHCSDTRLLESQLSY